MNLPSLSGAAVTGERVVIRVDMNVPFDDHGRIIDDFRIRQSLPTIRWVLARGGKVAICTHRGSPEGYDARFSVVPIAKRLAELIGEKVRVVRNPAEENPGVWRNEKVLFFENLRFFPGEQKNSMAFGKTLARWGDTYVNDAFAESHRNVASIVRLPRLLPGYAGLLLEKEALKLKKVFDRPKRPFLVIIGGAKISTKIRYIRLFLSRADEVIVGGALFNTILAASGRTVGRSIIEKGEFDAAERLKGARKLILPQDIRVLHRMDGDIHPLAHSVDDVGANDYICDIGPASTADFLRRIRKAGTVLWNGPLGYIEFPACREGTIAIARALAKSRAAVVIGGGDLEALWREARIPAKNIYMSTGGGALLDFVANGSLLGIEALARRTKRNAVK